MLAVVLCQEIHANAFPGFEKSGKELLPGKTTKVRLGLPGPVRHRLTQRFLCMGGGPAAYLTQVDAVMMRIINMIDEVSKHPDDHIRYLLTSEPGLFLMGPAGALTTANMPGTSSDKGRNGDGAVPKTIRICPDWFYTGKCRHKDGANGCVHQHPIRAQNAAKPAFDSRDDARKKKSRDRDNRERDQKKQNEWKDDKKNLK
jgi:hypothetical protein